MGTGIADRVKACIGDESVSAFARRCGIGESLIRKYLAGSEPSTTNAVRIADAANVDLMWLATGRGDKRRQGKEPEGNETFRSDALKGSPYTRRLEAILGLVEELPESQASAILDEFFARVQSATELAELRRSVAELLKSKKIA